MPHASASQPLPLEIGGYRILGALPDGGGVLATVGGRKVVLKAVEPDCLVRGRGRLHPNIRDRLGRVRELAHTGVANLHGVERDGERAYMVWEYVEGTPLEHYAVQPGRSSRAVTALARELVLSVESLHALGIVHGAIHGRNVIVDGAGAIRLTHISPLLHHDPRRDADAVVDLLRDLVQRREEEQLPLGRMLQSAPRGEGAMDLRQLGLRLARLVEDPDVDVEAARLAERRQRGSIRRRAMAGAAMAAMLGLVVAWGVRRSVDRGSHPAPLPVDGPVTALQPR